jgi:hypothetical protein
MYTNMCHDVRNPKGSSSVKLFILNNCVYIDELCIVIKSIHGSTYQTEHVKGLVSGDAVYISGIVR